jgi:protein-tyrosine phosphatase
MNVVHERLLLRGAFNSIENRVQLLQDAKVTTIFCCRQKCDPLLQGLPWLTYHHHPMSDSSKRVPVHEAVLAAHTAYLDWLRGANILIHCTGGQNRSGLVTALTLMLIRNCSGQAAYEAVKKARPITFTNQLFVRYLQTLASPGEIKIVEFTA